MHNLVPGAAMSSCSLFPFPYVSRVEGPCITYTTAPLHVSHVLVPDASATKFTVNQSCSLAEQDLFYRFSVWIYTVLLKGC